MHLTSERLVLRPLAEGDVAAFVAYRCDPDVARYQSWDIDYSIDDGRRLVAEQAGDTAGAPGTWFQLAVCTAEGALVGDVALHGDGDQPHTYEVGVTLDPAHQGHGYATEAVRALVDVCFADLGAHRVYAWRDARNDAVARVFDRLGFRVEATLVDADWCKGEWTTVVLHAVLRGDWPGSTVAR